MSTRGIGNALSTLGQGMLQYGTFKENQRWQQEREANYQRLQEANIASREKIQTESLAQRKIEAEATADYRNAMVANAGEGNDIRRLALSAEVDEATSRTALTAASKGLTYDPEDPTRFTVDPELTAHIQEINKNPPATIQMVDQLTATNIALRDEGVPELAELTDTEIRALAFNTVLAPDRSRAVSPKDQASMAQGVVDTLTEQLTSLDLVGQNDPAAAEQAATVRKQIAFYTRFIDEKSGVADYQRSLGVGGSPLPGLGGGGGPVDEIRARLGGSR